MDHLASQDQPLMFIDHVVHRNTDNFTVEVRQPWGILSTFWRQPQGVTDSRTSSPADSDYAEDSSTARSSLAALELTPPPVSLDTNLGLKLAELFRGSRSSPVKTQFPNPRFSRLNSLPLFVDSGRCYPIRRRSTDLLTRLVSERDLDYVPYHYPTKVENDTATGSNLGVASVGAAFDADAQPYQHPPVKEGKAKVVSKETNHQPYRRLTRTRKCGPRKKKRKTSTDDNSEDSDRDREAYSKESPSAADLQDQLCPCILRVRHPETYQRSRSREYAQCLVDRLDIHSLWEHLERVHGFINNRKYVATSHSRDATWLGSGSIGCCKKCYATLCGDIEISSHIATCNGKESKSLREKWHALYDTFCVHAFRIEQMEQNTSEEDVILVNDPDTAVGPPSVTTNFPQPGSIQDAGYLLHQIDEKEAYGVPLDAGLDYSVPPGPYNEFQTGSVIDPLALMNPGGYWLNTQTGLDLTGSVSGTGATFQNDVRAEESEEIARLRIEVEFFKTKYESERQQTQLLTSQVKNLQITINELMNIRQSSDSGVGGSNSNMAGSSRLRMSDEFQFDNLQR